MERNLAMPRVRPRALLLDYGGTLVEEVGYDLRAGNAWLLDRAAHRPPAVTLETVVERAALVAREVGARRHQVQIEMPWPALARLIHDYLGTTFDRPLAELELGFWQAAVHTRALPGAGEALNELRGLGIPVGVVSNTSFSEAVLRYELTRHGLADHLAFIMASSDYAIRKPNPMLFEIAAARLGIAAEDIWFVGDRLDTDVAGARAAGMTAVWLNPASQSSEPSADLTVASWDELVQRVRSC